MILRLWPGGGHLRTSLLLFLLVCACVTLPNMATADSELSNLKDHVEVKFYTTGCCKRCSEVEAILLGLVSESNGKIILRKINLSGKSLDELLKYGITMIPTIDVCGRRFSGLPNTDWRIDDLRSAIVECGGISKESERHSKEEVKDWNHSKYILPGPRIEKEVSEVPFDGLVKVYSGELEEWSGIRVDGVSISPLKVYEDTTEFLLKFEGGYKVMDVRTGEWVEVLDSLVIRILNVFENKVNLEILAPQNSKVERVEIEKWEYWERVDKSVVPVGDSVEVSLTLLNLLPVNLEYKLKLRINGESSRELEIGDFTLFPGESMEHKFPISFNTPGKYRISWIVYHLGEEFVSDGVWVEAIENPPVLDVKQELLDEKVLVRVFNKGGSTARDLVLILSTGDEIHLGDLPPGESVEWEYDPPNEKFIEGVEVDYSFSGRRFKEFSNPISREIEGKPELVLESVHLGGPLPWMKKEERFLVNSGSESCELLSNGKKTVLLPGERIKVSQEFKCLWKGKEVPVKERRISSKNNYLSIYDLILSILVISLLGLILIASKRERRTRRELLRTESIVEISANRYGGLPTKRDVLERWKGLTRFNYY